MDEMTDEQKKPTFDYHLTYTDNNGKEHSKVFINLLYRERFVINHFKKIVKGECSVKYYSNEPAKHEYYFTGGANGGEYKNLDLAAQVQPEFNFEDYRWLADRHRGTKCTTGPHWPMVIRFTPLFDEALRANTKELEYKMAILQIYASIRNMEIHEDTAKNIVLIHETCMRVLGIA